MLCDQILLNRHVILPYTIPKPHIHWKAFSIEISTGSEIKEDLHDGVEISLGTPIDDLNLIPHEQKYLC